MLASHFQIKEMKLYKAKHVISELTNQMTTLQTQFRTERMNPDPYYFNNGAVVQARFMDLSVPFKPAEPQFFYQKTIMSMISKFGTV